MFGVDLLDDAAAELEHEATYYEQRGGVALRDEFLDEFCSRRPPDCRAPSFVPYVVGKARHP
jgi:hypothetical protein